MSSGFLRFTALLSLPVTLAAARSARGEGPGKVDLKLEKGRAVEFTVRENSVNESESSRGLLSFKNHAETVYRIEVAERKDNGDLTLKVTIASLKAKDEGRDRPFEFDSAKSGAGDETAAPIREAIGKPLTVQVSGGRVKEVSGLPEPQRPADGERGFRGFAALRLVGRGTLTNHLEMILASAVQGQGLEKGKEYKLAEERPPGDQDGERRGRGRFGRGNRTAIQYKFEGDEQVEGAPAAKFSLSPRLPEGDRAGSERRKGTGTALVSAKDGLLLKLDFEAEGGGEFDRNGETMKYSRKSKIHITRGAAAPEPVKL